MAIAIYFRPGFLWLLAGLISMSLGDAQGAIAADSMDPNSPSEELTVLLGQPCDMPYVVMIPTRDEAVLERLQMIIPEAFLTRSFLGVYIHVAAFKDRASAERLSQQLTAQTFDARVTYHSPACQPPK